MTKAERIRLIRTYFEEIDRIEGKIPCIQWRHTKQRDIYLYSREDESLSSHEIVVVKSPNSKVDKVLKYAVRHYFQTEEELSVILRSFSAEAPVPKPVYETKKTQKPVPEQVYQPKQEPVAVGGNFGSEFRSHVSKPPVVSQAQQYTNGSKPHIPNQFTQPLPKSPSPAVKKLSAKEIGLKAGLALLIVLLLVAFVTNPDEEKHRRAVQENALTALQQTYPNIALVSQTSADGASESSADGEAAILGMVHSSDFLFFSLTELRLPEYEKIIGMGIFGKVLLKDLTDGNYPSQATASTETVQSAATVNSPVTEANQQEMKRAVIVAVMEKFFADPGVKDELTYKFVFHNRSNRNVKSFSGEVVFSDNSGEVIEVLPLTYDRPLGIGERAIYHITQDYQNSSETVARTDLSEMTIDWEPQQLTYNDGTSLSM